MEAENARLRERPSSSLQEPGAVGAGDRFRSQGCTMELKAFSPTGRRVPEKQLRARKTPKRGARWWPVS